MDNPIRRAICVNNTEYEKDFVLGKEYEIRDSNTLADFVDVYNTPTYYTTCYAYRFKDVEEVGDAWSTP